MEESVLVNFRAPRSLRDEYAELQDLLDNTVSRALRAFMREQVAEAKKSGALKAAW